MSRLYRSNLWDPQHQPAWMHAPFSNWTLNDNKAYPPVIKRGWLENPRTKWRFIAGKCIYTWGIFKRFDYWRILEGSKGYCIGAPPNQLAESCHKRLSKLLKMGIWFHKQTLVGTASNMPFGLWYVAQNLELQWAWKALWFRTTCCWLSIGPDRKMEVMLISAAVIMASRRQYIQEALPKNSCVGWGSGYLDFVWD